MRRFLTAADIPIGLCVATELDALQRQYGGKRGYGGPGKPDGHWLSGCMVDTEVILKRRAG